MSDELCIVADNVSSFSQEARTTDELGSSVPNSMYTVLETYNWLMLVFHAQHKLEQIMSWKHLHARWMRIGLDCAVFYVPANAV